MIHLFKRGLGKYKDARFEKEELIKNYYLDQNKNAVLHIHLHSIEEAFASFSARGHEELSPELTEYLDNVIYHIPLEYSLVLRFDAPDAAPQRQDTLRRVLANHYGLVLEDKRQDLKINTLTIVGLFLVGAALLAFSYFLASNGKGQLFTDMINIAGTFALWETVDLYLLDRKLKKVEKLNAAQTAMAQIVFEEGCEAAGG